MLKPLVPHMGGKTFIVKHILTLVPDFDEYREPFLGGGTVFAAIKSLFPKRKYWINDLYFNTYLTYVVVRDYPNELIERKKHLFWSFESGVDLFDYLKEYYFNKCDAINNPIDKTAHYTLIKNISYNGLCESFSEVRYLRIKNNFEYYTKKTLKYARLLQNVKITNLDYQEVVKPDGDNVFIYCDPPYYDTTGYYYGKKGELHKEFDHEIFANIMSNSHHKWLISYDNNEYIKQLFDGYKQITFNTTNFIPKKSKTKKFLRGELFILNYDHPFC